MNEDSGSFYAGFAGFSGLVLLTLIVLIASFVIGLGLGVALLGREHAIQAFLSLSLVAKLLLISFVVAALFWMRFWRQPRSRAGGV